MGDNIEKGLNIHINKLETLIIFDWDDTLYPTTWFVNNRIDLMNSSSIYKHRSYFDVLDKSISTIFRLALSLGKVVIITNAMPEWIKIATTIMPKTSKCLESIEIVSARKQFQETHNITEWKKIAFKNEISNPRVKYNNVLSFGDAEYEYIALLDLWQFSPNKYLKSIKLIKSPDNFELLEQIRIIRKNLHYLCKVCRHLDLKFRSTI